jgi:lauroyl/myristoyl acyltransferase
MSLTTADGKISDPVPASLLPKTCLLIALVSGRIIRLIPRSARAWGCNLVADVAFLVATRYRENAIANLRRVLGPAASDQRVRRTAREAFRTSVHNMTDLLRIQGIDDAAFAGTVDVAEGDWSMVDRASACGRGVVIVTAHLGVYDGLGKVFAAAGYPLTVVVGRTLPRSIFGAAIALRQALGMRIVEATPTGIRQLVETLRRGECIGFPIDRDFFRNGTAVDLFGHRTTLPTGAVRLARETGAPIIAVYLRRTATGYDLVLEEPFVVPRTGDRHADVAAGMVAIVASLTRAVAATPGQWAVFQPVWPNDGTDPSQGTP